MSPERYQRVRDLFHAASEREPALRGPYLDEACAGDLALQAEVEALLEFDERQPEFLHAPLISGDQFRRAATADAGEPAVNARPPTTIGGYRIVRVIGEGGMGIVYLAEQERPRRTVALKVLRPGLATEAMLRRFEREAQVLAMLQHPGIAQVYEVGVAQPGDQPFFAMEFIPGRPLNEYVASADLDTRQRLALLARVCHAVHHAHQKGVIHRDLKPANILVASGDETGLSEDSGPGKPRGTVTTHFSLGARHSIAAEGQPKVLDFGIARVTNSDVTLATLATDAGQIVGTLAYMSPEQVAGDLREIDVRSDIYALGVIGFELLAGRLPYEVRGRSIPEAVLIIRDHDPTPLRTVDRAFRGDIETIIAKALEKDPEYRYPTALALAADIEGYLNDQPIAARPASTFYQLRKLARRNRALVAGALLAVMSLVGGTVAATWQAVEATRQRDRALEAERLAQEQTERARAEAQTAARISTCLFNVFNAFNPPAVPAGPGFQPVPPTPQAILDLSAEAVAAQLKDQPLEQARLLTQLGTIYARLRMDERAEAVLESALALWTGRVGCERAEAVTCMQTLAGVLVNRGDYARAEQLYRGSLPIHRRLAAAGDLGVAGAENALSYILLISGQLDEAEAWAEQALGVFRRHAKDPEYVISSLGHNAAIKAARGRFAEAETLQREALELTISLVGRAHPRTAAQIVPLAHIRRRSGDVQSAALLFEDATTLAWESRSLEPLTAAWTLQSVAVNWLKQRDPRTAELPLRRALEICRQELGGEHVTFADLADDLADLLKAQGELDEAEMLYGQVLDIRRKQLGERHPEVGAALFRVAETVLAKGDMPGVERLYGEAKAHRELALTLPEDHPHRAGSLLLLGVLEMGAGRPEAAETHLRQCVELRRRMLGPEDKLTAYAESVLGECLTRLERFEEAEPLLLESLPRIRAHYSENHERTVQALERLVRLYEVWGKPDRAAPYRENLPVAGRG